MCIQKSVFTSCNIPTFELDAPDAGEYSGPRSKISGARYLGDLKYTVLYNKSTITMTQE
jgi:hypothetical protein